MYNVDGGNLERFRGGWGFHIISIIGFGVAVFVGKYPGIMKRYIGSTTLTETILMCGISGPVFEAFVKVEEFNHQSSIALRYWRQTSAAERRRWVMRQYHALGKKCGEKGHGSPPPGASRKGKGKGRKRGRDESYEALQRELASVGEDLDRLTRLLQEGKLLDGTQVTRAYRKLAMFVGLLVTGFEGAWITKEGCYKCGHRGDTARCCRCQCGICEGCGEFLAQASQKQVKGKWEWLGSSLACCEYSYGCKERQEQIIDFWKKKSGEAVQ